MNQEVRRELRNRFDSLRALYNEAYRKWEESNFAWREEYAEYLKVAAEYNDVWEKLYCEF